MGVVKFPRTRCEQLLAPLLWFAGEKHYDGTDDLVYFILESIVDDIDEKKFHYIQLVVRSSVSVAPAVV